MIDFTTVAREFRGLIDRRREVFTFLGTSFAALGLFLQNALQGGLPTSLHVIEDHIFAFYAGVLTALSLILSLRMAKMHQGIIINGMLFAHLMQFQNFTGKGDVSRAGRHNFLGVSFLQFLLVNLIGFFSTLVLGMSLTQNRWIAISIAVIVFLIWLCLYFRYHASGIRIAKARIATDQPGPVTFNEWEEHVSLCLQQSTQSLLSDVAFAGLMVFSCFEALSGLGRITAQADLPEDQVKNHADVAYGLLMVMTCVFQLFIYVRTYVAIGGFCLKLDPNDRPYAAFKITDSFLGYVTLAALFTVAVHVLLTMLMPSLEQAPMFHLMLDAAAFGIAILAHQIVMIIFASRSHRPR